MTPLAVLLCVKMGVTLFGVALPFLVLPKAWLDRLADFGDPDVAFYRLYGMAILALIVAYGGGLVQSWAGTYPSGVVVMGLVSNGGATAVLVATGRVRKAPGLTAFFGLVAVGFVIARLAPAWALQPL